MKRISKNICEKIGQIEIGQARQNLIPLEVKLDGTVFDDLSIV